MKKVETPELDRLKAIQDVSQKIGDFLEWLRDEKHYVIAQWLPTNPDSLMSVSFNIEGILAEYFMIDLNKVERERQAILEDFRKRQENK